MNRVMIEVDNEIYQLIRTLPVEEKYDTSILKQLWRCDKCFKKEGKYYFCRLVETVEYEEIEEEASSERT